MEAVEEAEEQFVESHYAPQLRLVNGELVIDEESLQVDRTKDVPETVYENQGDRFVNSHTWSKRQRAARWTEGDTALFYDAVSMFGTDFEMIAKLFPDRSRAQIKKKWNKEEKVNGDGLTQALKSRKKIGLCFLIFGHI
ncbi:hypothetical protein BT69DRAFT_1229968 [Atractiella rhizophila]|nr:hypothetical protein BT69DRAFT_1229968 [Atractiella rhizophila]